MKIATTATFIKYAVILLIVFSSGLYFTACSNLEERVDVSIATPRALQGSLLWIAQEKGLFAKQGVRVRLQSYPSGKRALAAHLRGEEDLAATAEAPFVLASFVHSDLRLYATVGKSDNVVRILARKDHGIHKPADLNEAVIATQAGSAVHFFLSSFQLYHHLNASKSSVRFMQIEDLPGALLRGDV